MNEADQMRKIMIDVSKETKTILFRNNVGTGWQGKIQKTDRGIHIENPRPLEAGLCKGSSDLIGWSVIEVTPDMIGKKIAIFTALEIKKSKGSTISKEQLNFLQQLEKSGGISGVALDSNEAINIISKMKLC